jgi:hypothetical protein
MHVGLRRGLSDTWWRIHQFIGLPVHVVTSKENTGRPESTRKLRSMHSDKAAGIA